MKTSKITIAFYEHFYTLQIECQYIILNTHTLQIKHCIHTHLHGSRFPISTKEQMTIALPISTIEKRLQSGIREK